MTHRRSPTSIRSALEVRPGPEFPVKTNSLSQIQSISKTTIATAQAGHPE
jgi:hypothetical protein